MAHYKLDRMAQPGRHIGCDGQPGDKLTYGLALEIVHVHGHHKPDDAAECQPLRAALTRLESESTTASHGTTGIHALNQPWPSILTGAIK